MVIAAKIDFDGLDNPLVGALPAELVFPLAEAPILKAIADQIITEARTRFCGGATVLTRLCEVIVVLASRSSVRGFIRCGRAAVTC